MTAPDKHGKPAEPARAHEFVQDSVQAAAQTLAQDADDDTPHGFLQKLVYAYFNIGVLSAEKRAVLLRQDNAGVRVPPPVIFLVFLLIGCAIDSAWLYGGGVPVAYMISGAGLSIAGLALIAWGFRAQRAVGTDVDPQTATTAIATDGPYNLTRNPMYLGVTAIYIGIAMMAGSPWSMGTLAVCMIVIDRYVIDREEAYLEEKFGDVYLNYKTRVRRWF